MEPLPAIPALAQFFGGAKHGQVYESITVNWNQASATIVDGTADAAVLTVHFPGLRETRNVAAGAMTMFSMPKDKFESAPAQKLLNKPGSVAYTAPVSFVKKWVMAGQLCLRTTLSVVWL